MIVSEVIDMSQRDDSSSHDSLRQAVKREDISDNEFNNDDGQTPCTWCKLAQEPCSTPTRRSEDIVWNPSECTCNRVYFNVWRACLRTEGILPDYEEWAKTCRNHSLSVSEEYPSQWTSRVRIPSWAVVAVASNSTFDVASTILVPRASEPAGIVPIVAPIAVVLALVALGAILAYLYWIKKRTDGESFSAFWRWQLSFHRAQRIQHRTRDSRFEIDQQSENTNDFIIVNAGDDYIGGHSRSSSGDSRNVRQPEYHFPFKNVWRNPQIIQQFRRIPDMMPYHWGYSAVHIRPSQPGRRFRVDPSGSSAEDSSSSAMNSHSGTAEGPIPDTIFEDEEDAESQYHTYDENEEESLIMHSERYENEVFLISHRPTFTVSSHSSNLSHQFKVVPPTPTESSRSHGRLSQVIPPTTLQLRRPIDIPPAPQLPAPVPPKSAPRRPSPLHSQSAPSRPQPLYNPTPLSRNDPPQPQPVPQPPQAPQPPNPNIVLNQKVPPHSVNPSQPGPSQHPPPASPPSQITQSRPRHAPRRPSGDGNDYNYPPRPVGGRLPSSHNIRRPSFDEDAGRFGPTIPSGDSILLTSPSRPPPPPLTRTLSGSEDDVSLVPPVPLPAPPAVLPPPRPTHGRTPSSESVIMAPGDNRLLYPGPVRAAGYNVNLPPDATESHEVHGRPLPWERTHH